MNYEKAFTDHVIQMMVKNEGRTVEEAKRICEAMKKNGPKAWKDAMDIWFDEVHPY